MKRFLVASLLLVLASPLFAQECGNHEPCEAGRARMKCARSQTVTWPDGLAITTSEYDGLYEPDWICHPDPQSGIPHCAHVYYGPDTRTSLTLVTYSSQNSALDGCRVNDVYDLVMSPYQSTKGALEFTAPCVYNDPDGWQEPMSFYTRDLDQVMLVRVAWYGLACVYGDEFSFSLQQVTTSKEVGLRQIHRH